MTDAELLEIAEQEAAGMGLTMAQYARLLAQALCAAIDAKRAELAAEKAA